MTRIELIIESHHEMTGFKFLLKGEGRQGEDEEDEEAGIWCQSRLNLLWARVKMVKIGVKVGVKVSGWMRLYHFVRHFPFLTSFFLPRTSNKDPKSHLTFYMACPQKRDAMVGWFLSNRDHPFAIQYIQAVQNRYGTGLSDETLAAKLKEEIELEFQQYTLSKQRAFITNQSTYRQMPQQTFSTSLGSALLSHQGFGGSILPGYPSAAQPPPRPHHRTRGRGRRGVSKNPPSRNLLIETHGNFVKRPFENTVDLSDDSEGESNNRRPPPRKRHTERDRLSRSPKPPTSSASQIETRSPQPQRDGPQAAHLEDLETKVTELKHGREEDRHKMQLQLERQAHEVAMQNEELKLKLRLAQLEADHQRKIAEEALQAEQKKVQAEQMKAQAESFAAQKEEMIALRTDIARDKISREQHWHQQFTAQNEAYSQKAIEAKEHQSKEISSLRSSVVTGDLHNEIRIRELHNSISDQLRKTQRGIKDGLSEHGAKNRQLQIEFSDQLRETRQGVERVQQGQSRHDADRKELQIDFSNQLRQKQQGVEQGLLQQGERLSHFQQAYQEDTNVLNTLIPKVGAELADMRTTMQNQQQAQAVAASQSSFEDVGDASNVLLPSPLAPHSLSRAHHTMVADVEVDDNFKAARAGPADMIREAQTQATTAAEDEISAILDASRPPDITSDDDVFMEHSPTNSALHTISETAVADTDPTLEARSVSGDNRVDADTEHYRDCVSESGSADLALPKLVSDVPTKAQLLPSTSSMETDVVEE